MPIRQLKISIQLDIEFEEEHIPGAVNIPLDELRQRYGELRQDKEYFVYCLGGARSTSAAFLLNNQGFRARSIR
ncbi:MAG TPA: CoA-disulfide reductase, partial [Nitrospirae bacterium]|nr:CoA-disulfide reductase [Nitrospirota bacterium]